MRSTYSAFLSDRTQECCEIGVSPVDTELVSNLLTELLHCPNRDAERKPDFFGLETVSDHIADFGLARCKLHKPRFDVT